MTGEVEREGKELCGGRKWGGNTRNCKLCQMFLVVPNAKCARYPVHMDAMRQVCGDTSMRPALKTPVFAFSHFGAFHKGTHLCRIHRRH